MIVGRKIIKLNSLKGIFFLYSERMKRLLNINQLEVEAYATLAASMPEDFPEKYRFVYDLAVSSLKSKQCNEPYEKNLSKILGVVNLELKHGFDAVDNLECSKEVYEYKPSSKKKSPGGTINDDSIAKIEKCERLKDEEKMGWMVLGGIDKDMCRFDCLYKFPLYIYSEDRRKYFADLMEKNKSQAKQTRSTYKVSVNKSIELCKQFNEDYYVWKRGE